MQEFTLRVRSEEGLTIPKIEELVKLLENISAEVFFLKGQKRANARLIFNLLSLSIRHGDILTVQLVGDHEEAERDRLQSILNQLL